MEDDAVSASLVKELLGEYDMDYGISDWSVERLAEPEWPLRNPNSRPRLFEHTPDEIASARKKRQRAPMTETLDNWVHRLELDTVLSSPTNDYYYDDGDDDTNVRNPILDVDSGTVSDHSLPASPRRKRPKTKSASSTADELPAIRLRTSNRPSRSIYRIPDELDNFTHDRAFSLYLLAKCGVSEFRRLNGSTVLFTEEIELELALPSKIVAQFRTPTRLFSAICDSLVLEEPRTPYKTIGSQLLQIETGIHTHDIYKSVSSKLPRRLAFFIDRLVRNVARFFRRLREETCIQFDMLIRNGASVTELQHAGSEMQTMETDDLMYRLPGEGVYSANRKYADLRLGNFTQQSSMICRSNLAHLILERAALKQMAINAKTVLIDSDASSQTTRGPTELYLVLSAIVLALSNTNAFRAAPMKSETSQAYKNWAWAVKCMVPSILELGGTFAPKLSPMFGLTYQNDPFGSKTEALIYTTSSAWLIAKLLENIADGTPVCVHVILNGNAMSTAKGFMPCATLNVASPNYAEEVMDDQLYIVASRKDWDPQSDTGIVNTTARISGTGSEITMTLSDQERSGSNDVTAVRELYLTPSVRQLVSIISDMSNTTGIENVIYFTHPDTLPPDPILLQDTKVFRMHAEAIKSYNSTDARSRLILPRIYALGHVTTVNKKGAGYIILEEKKDTEDDVNMDLVIKDADGTLYNGPALGWNAFYKTEDIATRVDILCQVLTEIGYYAGLLKPARKSTLSDKDTNLWKKLDAIYRNLVSESDESDAGHLVATVLQFRGCTPENLNILMGLSVLDRLHILIGKPLDWRETCPKPHLQLRDWISSKSPVMSSSNYQPTHKNELRYKVKTSMSFIWKYIKVGPSAFYIDVIDTVGNILSASKRSSMRIRHVMRTVFMDVLEWCVGESTPPPPVIHSESYFIVASVVIAMRYGRYGITDAVGMRLKAYFTRANLHKQRTTDFSAIEMVVMADLTEIMTEKSRDVGFFMSVCGTALSFVDIDDAFRINSWSKLFPWIRLALLIWKSDVRAAKTDAMHFLRRIIAHLKSSNALESFVAEIAQHLLVKGGQEESATFMAMWASVRSWKGFDNWSTPIFKYHERAADFAFISQSPSEPVGDRRRGPSPDL